jgi:GTP-binding protein LepA
MNKIKRIRNFSIIAHIDHGKSTLADRFLEITKTVPDREMAEQYLDDMDLEREKGITIKAHAVRILYKGSDKNVYIFNLIDTPGHVDFTYEVSRSLAACEGALLVVDAVQGVQAQTLANIYLALENKLKIIPVINKIDLFQARPEFVSNQLIDILNVKKDEISFVSAKTGEGVSQLMERIVRDIPSPKGDNNEPLQALIFDSIYNPYRGVVAFIRIKNGFIEKGNEIEMMAKNISTAVEEIGVFSPKMTSLNKLSTGEVGYLITGLKDVQKVVVGDTITNANFKASSPLAGYREPKPMVYCGLYPVDGGQYELLKDSISKLKLNDAALYFESETSPNLGFGFRCGFLGLLHMDIVIERLKREYGLDLLATIPQVEYKVITHIGEETLVKNPTDFPTNIQLEKVEEPYVIATIYSPVEYIGSIMDLCREKRGEFLNISYPSQSQVHLEYEIPLSEIIVDFFDLLKSITHGYGSLDYELSGYKKSDIIKLDIKLAGNTIDAFSIMIHRDKAYRKGKELTKRLKELIPRQIFQVSIQAAIGKRVIARETIPALRKDVTAKLYGGDVTRKRKLLEKQKAGKKKLKKFGKVEVPSEIFRTLFKIK